jgi:hypothetical protein
MVKCIGAGVAHIAVNSPGPDPLMAHYAIDVACNLVGGAEFESATPWMSTKYSNQLN